MNLNGSNRTKQRGFLSFESLIGLAVTLSVIGIGVALVAPANLAKKVGIAALQTDQIDKGASRWGSDKQTGMTGITMTLLSASQYIESDLSDGAKKNPWGGNYSIIVGPLQYQFKVQLTAVPADACLQLADKLARKAATCDSSAQTVTYTISV